MKSTSGLSMVNIPENETKSNDLLLLSMKISGGLVDDVDDDRTFFADSKSHETIWIINGTPNTQNTDE